MFAPSPKFNSMRNKAIRHKECDKNVNIRNKIA